MISHSSLITDILNHKNVNRPAVWFMRQAGRYLPEYLEIRKKSENFLQFCYSPLLASEATLQPIRRFNLDAAIIFSDILVIPDALGFSVMFKENEGPCLEKITAERDLKEFNKAQFLSHLEPVYEALRLTRANLPKDKALIGFVGACWTLAVYLLEGKSSKDFSQAKIHALGNSALFARLMTLLEQAIILHACKQIEAGAEIIQIFDSWAGILPEESFKKWIIEPTIRIVKEIKKAYPLIPIIGFPKGAGFYYQEYVEKTGVTGISLDSTVPLSLMKQLQNTHIIQGNLDPSALFLSQKELREKVNYLLGELGNQPFIFNLGHGILPKTPIENVNLVADLVLNFKR